MTREGDLKLFFIVLFIIFTLFIILNLSINIISFDSFYSILIYVVIIFIITAIPMVILLTYIKHRNITSSNIYDLIKSKASVIEKDDVLNTLLNKIKEKEKELKNNSSQPFITKESKELIKKITMEIKFLIKKLNALIKINERKFKIEDNKK